MRSEAELIQLFRDAAVEIVGRDFPNLTPSSEISELGIDSVDLLEIFGYVEDELHIKLSDADLAEITTLKDLAKLIQRS